MDSFILRDMYGRIGCNGGLNRKNKERKILFYRPYGDLEFLEKTTVTEIEQCSDNCICCDVMNNFFGIAGGFTEL